METYNARKQKAFAAEKQTAVVRAIVIVFGAGTYFLLNDERTKSDLALWLMPVIWFYGGFVLLYRPYEKLPIFLTSWFTYSTDALFITLWVYATGGVHSPYHIIYCTSIIAVTYRFGLRTMLFTCALYVACYAGLVLITGGLRGNEGLMLVRCGFIFIVGLMAYQITRETLWQTRQKLQLASLMKAARETQKELVALNEELRLRNDLFNHAEQNANLGSYYLELPGGSLEYSENLFRLLDHHPGDFVPTVETYLEFVHPDDRDEFRKLVENTLGGGDTQTHVHRVITGAGQLKYLRATGKVMKEKNATLVIGTLQDVSGDVSLNEELREKNAQLEAINNELSSFNYVASHDLQEPVRKILTFTELIRDREKDNLTQTAHNYLSRIASAAKRMQQLIEAFLNYSHTSHGELSFELVDLNLLMDEVRSIFADQLEEKKATLTWDPLPQVTGVRIQLQQMFINFIGNALKYGRDGVSPRVHVSASKVSGLKTETALNDETGEFWKISFRDNGIGFEPGFNERIFDVFVRLHSKDRYEGSGIGLSICKKIAAIHKGFVRAEGRPGEGATFHVYLPLRQLAQPVA